MQRQINYLDLFSGAGGFRLGLEQAGFEFKWEGHSELDRYANSVYGKHFPNSEELGDITGLTESRLDELGEIGILTGGFPCQDVSISGQRRGLEGRRSGLFYELMRVIEYKKPKVFILENVLGLFSSNRRRDFESVLRRITDIGVYDCEWSVINSKLLIPQNRERIYIIGHLTIAGGGGFKVFPLREGYRRNFDSQGETKGKGKRIRKSYSSCLSSRDYKDGGDLIQSVIGVKRNVGKDELDIAYTLNISDYRGLNRNQDQNAVKVKRAPLKFLDRNQKNTEGDYSFTIDSMNTGGVSINDSIRRLTPVETERLQMFPDNWSAYGKDGEQISDSQRYKLMGNAVTVGVIEHIGKALLEN